MSDSYRMSKQEEDVLVKALRAKEYMPGDAKAKAKAAFSKADGDVNRALTIIKDIPDYGELGTPGPMATVTAESTNQGALVGKLNTPSFAEALKLGLRAGIGDFREVALSARNTYQNPGSIPKAPTQAEIAIMLSDPGSILHGQKWDKKTRESYNARMKRWGRNELVIDDLDDDIAWSEREIPDIRQINPVFEQGPDIYRGGDVAKATAYGFVNSATFGGLHAVNALTRTAGLDSDWWTGAKDTWLQYNDTEYTRAGELLGSTAGFFAPTKWAGAGIRVGAKGVKAVAGTRAGVAVGKKVTSTAAGKVAATGVKAAVSGTAKAAETTLNLATRYTAKTIFEAPKVLVQKAATYGAVKALGTNRFVRATGRAIESSSEMFAERFAHSAIGRDPALTALWEKIGPRVTQRALSKAVGNAWQKARGNQFRKLVEAGEKDALEEAEKMFSYEVAKEIRKAYGNKIGDKAVAEMTEAMLMEFRIAVRGKTGRKFRDLLMNPIGIKGIKKDFLGRNFLKAAETGAAFSVHRATSTFLSMLGYSAMTVQAMDDDPWYKKGQLYITGAKEYFINNAHEESYVKTFATGAFFGTQGGTSFIPGSVPFLGRISRAANPFPSIKKAIFGPKFTRSNANLIMAEEFSASHKLIMDNIDKVFGKGSSESIKHFLSSVPDSNRRMSRRIWKKLLGTDVEKLSLSQLGRIAAMMRAQRAKAASSVKDFRRGKGEDLRGIDDGLPFTNRHIEILLNPAGKTVDQINKARRAVVNGLNSNFEQIVSNHRKVNMAKAAEDAMFTLGFRAPATFLATGGYHMLKDYDDTAEDRAAILSHFAFSVWASAEPVFKGGAYLKPGGWHKGRELAVNQEYMPGWSDAAIKVGSLEREMKYMDLGTVADSYPNQDIIPDNASITMTKPLESQRTLMKDITDNITDYLGDDAIGGMGLDKDTGRSVVRNIVYPGQKPVAKNQLGPMIQVENYTSTEKEHARSILLSLAKNLPDTHPLLRIDGLTPADGTEWVRALDSVESRRDMILSIVTGALKKSFVRSGVMKAGEDLNYIHAVKATLASGQRISAQYRHSLARLVNDLRWEQLNTKATDRTASTLNWFQFRDNPELNTRISNALDMGRLMELNLNARVINKDEYLGNAQITYDESAYAAADGMLQEEVSEILDRFEEEMHSMGLDPSLTLSDGKIKQRLLEHIEEYGQSSLANIIVHEQIMPLYNRDGLLSQSRILEGYAAGGLLGKDSVTGRYILKDVTKEVIDSMDDMEKNELMSSILLVESMPEVFHPSKALYKKMSRDMTITNKNKIKIKSPHTFSQEKHPQYMNEEVAMPAFEHEHGIVGALRDAGMPLNSYNYAKQFIGRSIQHRQTGFTDNYVTFIHSMREAGREVYDENGRRLIPPTELEAASGANIFRIGSDVDIDSRVHFDAIRAAWNDPTATGELQYRTITPESMLDKMVSMFEQVSGHPPNNAELSTIQDNVDRSPVKFIKDIGQEIMDNLGYYDGWATDTGKIDGKVEVYDLPEMDARQVSQQLAFALNPLVDATSNLERREMVDAFRKKLWGIRGKSKDNKLIQKISKIHADVGYLLSKNDPRSIEKLHRLLQGTRILVMTQGGGRPNVELDFGYIEDVDIETIINKLDLINRGITESLDMRSEFIKRTNSAPNRLQTLLPDLPVTHHGNSLQEIMADIGLGTGSANSAVVVSGLTEVAENLSYNNVTNIDEYREGFRDVLEAGIRTISTEGAVASRNSIYQTRGEMRDRIADLSDADIFSIIHQTTDMREYQIISPGRTNRAVSVPSSLPVNDPGTADGSRPSARETKLETGHFAVRTAIRKRGPIDDLSDRTNTPIHTFKNFDKETGKNLLHEPLEREQAFMLAWHDGIDALDPSERGGHMLRISTDTGQPIVNRMVIVERTQGENMAFPAPYSRNDLTDYQELIDGMVERLDKNVGRHTDQQYLIDKTKEISSEITEWIREQDESDVPQYDIYNMVARGNTTYTNLSNIYRMLLREALVGSGGMATEVTGDAGLKGSKRIKQLTSDSAQRMSSVSFEMAIQSIVENGETEFIDAVDNISVGSGVDRRYNILPIKESELAELSGVEDLDGNFMLNPTFMRIMAKALGYDDIEEAHGVIKAFVHMALGENMVSDKGLLAIPEDRVVEMMDRMGVAGFWPRSTIKIGADAVNFQDIMVNGQPQHVHRASWSTADGSGRLRRADEGLIRLNPNDVKFQNMPHPESSGTAITGQMTVDWHPDVVTAFNRILPANELVTLAGALMGDLQQSNMTLARALLTDADLNPIVAQGDIYAKRASLSTYMMMSSDVTTPAMFFRKQLQNRVLAIVRETLFKGYTVNGFKASFTPDGTYAKDSTEFGFPNMAKKKPVLVSEGAMGVKRTKKLRRNKKGELSLNPNGTPIVDNVSFDDAATHQKNEFLFKGEHNYYNTPSRNVEPIPGRESLWFDYGLNSGAKRNALSGAIEEWYAGGTTGVPMRGFTPLQSIFTTAAIRGYANDGSSHFENASEAASEMYHQMMTNSDVNSMIRRNGTIDQLATRIKENVNPNVHQHVDALADEVKGFISGYMYDSSPSGGLNSGGRPGSISAENIHDMFTMLMGHRTGDSWNNINDAYQMNERLRTPDGKTELAGNKGKTPITYAELSLIQRSPSSKPNDTIPAHSLYFLESRRGSQIVGNRKDTAGIMEGDNDGDKASVMMSLPREMVGEALRLRNIMGGVGVQKTTKKETGYTYLVADDGNEFSQSPVRGNQYLRYLGDQDIAEVMKGQFVSVRSVASNFISNNIELRYIGRNKDEVQISPVAQYEEFMDQYMPELISILERVQEVLDVPGSFMDPELKSMNIDHEIFGNILQKGTRSTKTEDFSRVTRDPARQGSKGDMNDAEYAVIGSIRRLLSRGAAIARDEHVGGESISKNWEVTYDFGIEMHNIFRNKRITPSEGLRKYIMEDLEALGATDPEVEQILESLTIKTNNNMLFPDFIAETIVKMGSIMEGDLLRVNTPESVQGKATVLDTVHESDDMKKLRQIQHAPAMQGYIRWLTQEASRGGDSSTHAKDELKIQKAKLRNTQEEEAKIALVVQKPENERMLKRYELSAVEGTSIMATMMTIPQTMSEDASRTVDALASKVIQIRNQSWAAEISQKGGKVAKETAQVTDRVREVYVNDVVRDYFEMTLEPDWSNFDEVAIRLIEPQRLATYMKKGAPYVAFKPLKTDLVNAILEFDFVRGNNLMTRVEENAMITATLWRNGSVRFLKELQQMTMDQSSWQGRVGEARTMLRRNMDWTVKDPIKEVLHTLATRRPHEVGVDQFGDYVASGIGGGQIKVQEALLRDVMQSAANLELNPDEAIYIEYKVAKRSVLDLPAAREFYGQDFDQGGRATVQRKNMNLENRAFAKDVEAEYRKALAKKRNEKSKKFYDEDTSKDKGSFKPVRPDAIKLTAGDIAEVTRIAEKRMINAAKIISAVSQKAEIARFKEKGEASVKDYDNGLTDPFSKADEVISKMGHNTQDRENRRNDKCQ